MRVQWMGLTTLPADSLPTLDWNAGAILAGTFIGTAVAVFFGYKAKRADPATPSKDVVLPTATIADMRWGSELLIEAKGINSRLDALQLCITGWREDIKHEQELREAYEKGRQARERGGRHDGL